MSTPAGAGRACGRAALLAPGGFVAGFLGGTIAGRALSGCPLLGGYCASAVPLLVAPTLGILGMGAGNGLAAARVGLWWEGVLAWGAGIVATLALVALVGWLDLETALGRLVPVAWLLVAILAAVIGRRKPDNGE